MNEKAIKHDEEKVRLELLSATALTEIARVMTYGANKYTTIKKEDLIEWLGYLNVDIQIENIKPVGYVALVTKRGLSPVIQNIDEMCPSINNNMANVTANSLTNTELLTDNQRKRNEKNENVKLNENMDLLSKDMKNYWLRKAESALSAQSLGVSSTSTIVMTVDGCEASYVLGATTASAFLTTLRSLLNKQWNISESPHDLIRSGAHNWRLGFDWSRLYGAALRHLTAHMDGEDVDPETGLSHLAHLGCCVMFLLEHEKKGLGNDDRYKRSSSQGAPNSQGREEDK